MKTFHFISFMIHAFITSFIRWGRIRARVRTRRAMRACVRRERTCSTPCARPVSDPARRRRRTVAGRPPVVVRVHWTWMHWDARRGRWCVRARGRRDDSTDGIPFLYSFPSQLHTMAAHYPVRAPRARVAASTARLGGVSFRLTPTFLSFPPFRPGRPHGDAARASATFFRRAR